MTEILSGIDSFEVVGSLPFSLATPDALHMKNGLAVAGSDTSRLDMILASGVFTSWNITEAAAANPYFQRITSLRWLNACDPNPGEPTGGIDVPTNTGGTTTIPPGKPGQVLVIGPDGKPQWADPVGGEGWPFENILHVVSEAELVAAIAATDDSTIIMIDNDLQLTSPLVIDHPVALASLAGGSARTLKGPVAGGAAVQIVDTGGPAVTFIHMSLSAFESNVIEATNSGLKMVDCDLQITGSPSVSDVACIKAVVDDEPTMTEVARIKLIDCYFTSANEMSDYGNAVWAIMDPGISEGLLIVEMDGGRSWMTANPDVVIDDCEASFFYPILRAGVLLVDTGTFTGFYYDGLGNRQPPDGRVRVSEDDTSLDYLYNKFSVTSPLSKSIINPGAAETLGLILNVASINHGALANLTVGDPHPQYALESDGETKDVPADFATIQGAIDYFNKKVVTGAIINVSPGTYNEALAPLFLLGTHGLASLQIIGDTRALAGVSWVDGSTVISTQTGAGSGTVSLSNAGNVITVTCSGGNPSFTGWINGDKLLAFNNAGSITEYTISSVSGNQITLTTTAPTLGNDGTSITLLPNVRVENSSVPLTVNASRITVKGIYFLCTGSNNGIQVGNVYNTAFTADHCVVFLLNNTNICFNAQNFCTAVLSESSLIRGINGMRVTQMARGSVSRCTIIDPAGAGVDSFFFGHAIADNAIVTSSGGSSYHSRIMGSVSAQSSHAIGSAAAGYQSEQQSLLYAVSSTAKNCLTGYQASHNGYLNASGTSGNLSGNTTNYSPAVSNTEGNVSGIITWS